MTFVSAMGAWFMLLQVVHTPPVLNSEGAGTLAAPYGALDGGWVIADVQVSAEGKVGSVTPLVEQPPFGASVVGLISGWTFQPATDDTAPAAARVSVTALFRQPAIYDHGGALQLDLSSLEAEERPALPLSARPPAYPADSVAEGSVILALEIDEAGGVGELEVVQGIQSLTEAAVDAVSAWTFSPALREGRPAPGLAIAVIYFQRPVIADVN